MQLILAKIRPWVWAAVWFTLPVSLRINTFFLILFGIVTIVSAFYNMPRISRKQWTVIVLFFLLFMWYAVSFLVDPDKVMVWKNLERKLSLITIPVLLALFIDNKAETEKWAVRGFIAGLLVTGLHMGVIAVIHIIQGKGLDQWTYHNFTAPYKIGAVYYSWYLSIAIIYLATRKPKESPDKLKAVILFFLLVLLLLSSSKLFIILTLPVLAWQFFKYWGQYQSKTKYLILGVALAILAFGMIPFLSRVSELSKPDVEVLNQKEFTYDTPFNGLTIRLLQWRFAIEILNDHHAWLTGVGIGNCQSILDNYYIKHNVYHGNPDLGDTGYLGYNFHNQYFETLVGTGIPGLFILITLILIVFTQPRKTFIFPYIIYIIVLIFFITESVLERQTGIVLFCLLWATPISTNIKNN